MSERHESGKTSHNRGETMSNQEQYPQNHPQPSLPDPGQSEWPKKAPRFQVRPSARPGGYYWEAFDTQHPRKVMGAPTLDQARAQARADELNAKTGKKHTVRNIVIGITIGIFVLIGGCTALIGGALSSVDTSSTPVVTPVDNGPDTITTPTTVPSPPATTAPKLTKAAPKLTAAQEQAIGSAESYLQFTAFSRKGLIQQLSSDYGEGFSVADASFAVDHIKVNWNEQAARSAKSYLATQHFSRKGLIHQLESPYGEQFTHAQAVYGVNKAGL